MISKCCVCTEPETLNNLVFNCSNCDIDVHQLCYGIDSGDEHPWLCSPCLSNCCSPICELCLTSGGALKKTTSMGKWVHVVCALFTEGVKFEDNNQMEPVNISKIPDIYHNKKCVFCSKILGICCECTRPNCQNWLHITCAQKSNCLVEVAEKDDKIKFESYCPQHKPVDGATRRISSNFVREQIFEKTPTPLQGVYKLVYDEHEHVSDKSGSISTNNTSNGNDSLKFLNANDESEVIQDDATDIYVNPEECANATKNITVSDIESAIVQRNFLKHSPL